MKKIKTCFFKTCLFRMFCLCLVTGISVFGDEPKIFEGSFETKENRVIVTFSNLGDEGYILKFIRGIVPYQIGYSSNLALGSFVVPKIGRKSYVFLNYKKNADSSPGDCSWQLSFENKFKGEVPEFVSLTISYLSEREFFGLRNFGEVTKAFGSVKVVCRKAEGVSP